MSREEDVHQIDQGDSDKAVDAFQKAIQKDPNDHEAWKKLGNARYNQGRYAEAVSAYEKAIEIKPDFHETWNNLGLAHEHQGRYAEAVSAYENAIEIEPDKHEAWYNLGLAHEHQGRYAEAVSAYENAIEIKPDFHEAWNNLGNAHDNQGRYAEAVSAYEKAIEIKPDYHEAWNNLGLAHGNQVRYAEAVSAFEKTIEMKPDFHEAWYNLGVSMEKSVGAGSGQQHIAVSRALKLTALGAADERYEADAEDWVLVGRVVWRDHGVWDRALACAQKALDAEPTHPDALTLMAEASLEMGDLSKAEKHLNELEEAHPGHAPAYLPLSKLLLRQGRHDEARETLCHAYDQHFIDAEDMHTHMMFMEMFEQVELPDYAISCCIGGYQRGDREICEYHRARILWRTNGAPSEARAVIEKFLRSDSTPMPQILILDADIALSTGDFKRVRKRLDEARAHEEFAFLDQKERNWWVRLYDDCL
jgi:superkiller protein 3